MDLETAWINIFPLIRRFLIRRDSSESPSRPSLFAPSGTLQPPQTFVRPSSVSPQWVRPEQMGSSLRFNNDRFGTDGSQQQGTPDLCLMGGAYSHSQSLPNVRPSTILNHSSMFPSNQQQRPLLNFQESRGLVLPSPQRVEEQQMRS